MADTVTVSISLSVRTPIIDQFAFYRLGALHLPRLARALFDLPGDPVLTVEEINTLENAVRQLSPKLLGVINLMYRAQSGDAQWVALLLDQARGTIYQRQYLALDALRQNRNVRRLGRELIAEEWRRTFLYQGMTPIALE